MTDSTRVFEKMDASQVSEFKSKINKAFRLLRNKGYFARMNFLCCQGCAWNAVPEEKSNKVVFYHNQDWGTALETGGMYLAWSGDKQEIEDALHKVGLKTLMPENKDERFYVSID